VNEISEVFSFNKPLLLPFVFRIPLFFQGSSSGARGQGRIRFHRVFVCFDKAHVASKGLALICLTVRKKH